MFAFIKMSSGWYGSEVEDLEQDYSITEEWYNLQIHVDSGNLVILSDNIEGFTHEMGIEPDEVKMV